VVVPRQVDMVVDIRADRQEDVEEARRLLLEDFERVSAARGLQIVAEDFDVRPVQEFPRKGVELVEKAARDEGYQSAVLATLAGHDSVPLNQITPSVMFFVPSVGGVSHCEREFTSDEDMLAGLSVLSNVVARLVTGELEGVAPGSA
jgi:beta-ureidopropionase / N-carbamoyl-L-amino-acid hydrolase